MAKVTVGGDAERYMDPPTIQSGDGDGPSFIASVLDLLGIHKQVAAGDNKKSASQDVKVDPIAPPPNVPIASGVENVLNMVESIGDVGPSRSADQNNPFVPIDPDLAIGLPKRSR